MSDETKPKEETPAPEAPKWEYKTEFGINTQMREVVRLTVSATEAEIKLLRRKLEKLQYGS
jgi:hypothetical protein